jgi:hypothetical protein
LTIARDKANIMNSRDTYTINVTTAPGMDHKQVANEVVRQLGDMRQEPKHYVRARDSKTKGC